MERAKTSYDNSLQNTKMLTNDILNNTPTLRIGLTEQRDSIEFRSSGRFSVYNNEGIAILRSVTSPTKWKIKVEQSYHAKYAFNILIGKFLDFDEAQELNYELIEKGVGAQIKTLGDKLYYGDNLINDNSFYWVVVDNFISEDDAKKFAKDTLNELEYKIVTEKVKEPGAILEIFDPEFEKLCQATNVIRLVPENSDAISYLYDITHDDGEKLRHTKCCTFNGVVEFRCNNKGKLIIIHELPLEKYVESVVASEMKPDYPGEALKAFAITIRSKTIAGLRIKHRDDPFDLCATSHCQLFTGIPDAIDVKITNAVKDTIGQVLVNNNDKIYDSNHCLVCGGYTGNPSILNSVIVNEYNTSVYDGNGEYVNTDFNDLSNEDNFRKFINEEPLVLCNFAGDGDFNYFQKYFRWEVTYYRKELEEIISTKNDTVIGTIYDIISTKRSMSGRLTEVEIIASNVNLVIEGEMNIRKILSHNILNSSSFYINKEFDEEGIPLSFTFKGAGMGHGVGLCHAGTIKLGKKGVKCEQILGHYFNGTKIKNIY